MKVMSNKFEYIKKNEVENLKDNLNIVIMTATDIEKETVFKYLKPLSGRSLKVDTNSKQTYTIGVLGKYQVVHVHTNMGSSSPDGSTLTTKDVLDYWKPKAIIMPGIAFGIDSTKQKIGDVLISEYIIQYDSAKIKEGIEIPRGPIVRSGLLLFERFRNCPEWVYKLEDGSEAKKITGRILSGSKLVDDKEFKQHLLKHFPEAIGGEMEGAGIYAASFHESFDQWILVKGICDWAEKKESEDKKKNQRIAAEAAVSLCCNVMQNPNAFVHLEIKSVIDIKNDMESKKKEHISDYHKKHLTQKLTLMPPRSQTFIGRSKSFEDLDKLNDKVVLIKGMGGIGKTELCKAYFWEKYNAYKYVGWINYESSIKESIVNQLIVKDIKFSENDNIDEKYKNILHYLSELESCLLIIDNINNVRDTSLIDLSRLPFRIIANSKITLDNFTPYHLDFIDEDNCEKLFCEYYGNVTDDNLHYLKKIIKLSGRHTLTIKLLAKQCKYSVLSIKELFNSLEEHGFSLNGVEEEISMNNGNDNARLIDHLSKIFNIFELKEAEKMLITVMAIHPNFVMTKKDIKRTFCLKTFNELNSLVYKGWLQDEEDKIILHEVIGEVVRNNDHNTKFIHRLNKNLQKEHLQDSDNPSTKVKYTGASGVMIQHSTKDTDDPHFKEAVEFMKKSIEQITTDLKYATYLNDLALSYKNEGKYADAEPLYKQALEIRKKFLGNNHPDTAISLNNLALLYQKQDRYNDSQPLYKQALEISKKTLGVDNPLTASILNNIAGLYEAKGRYADAEPLYKQALEIDCQALGAKHKDTCAILDNLAYFYEKQGKHIEIKKLFDKYKK